MAVGPGRSGGARSQGATERGNTERPKRRKWRSRRGAGPSQSLLGEEKMAALEGPGQGMMASEEDAVTAGQGAPHSPRLRVVRRVARPTVQHPALPSPPP